MRYGRAFLIGSVVAFAATFASEPGQPLDCSDWVALVPGLYCEQAVDCDGPLQPWCSKGTMLEVDNQTGSRFEPDDVIQCPSGLTAGLKLGFDRLTDGDETFLGYFRYRCGTPGTLDRADFIGGALYNQGNITFDEERGCVYFTVVSYCQNNETSSCPYLPKAALLRICGFTTTFEILQTYAPTGNEISFRVPYMPEGFPATDSFDTYYGDLVRWATSPRRTGFSAAIRLPFLRSAIT